MLREKDIVHENGNYWVLDDQRARPKAYVVFKVGVTHSVSDSAYQHDADGRSIAIARCDYLAGRSK